jgi:hypothetical protein
MRFNFRHWTLFGILLAGICSGARADDNRPLRCRENFSALLWFQFSDIEADESKLTDIQIERYLERFSKPGGYSARYADILSRALESNQFAGTPLLMAALEGAAFSDGSTFGYLSLLADSKKTLAIAASRSGERNICRTSAEQAEIITAMPAIVKKIMAEDMTIAAKLTALSSLRFALSEIKPILRNSIMEDIAVKFSSQAQAYDSKFAGIYRSVLAYTYLDLIVSAPSEPPHS